MNLSLQGLVDLVSQSKEFEAVQKQVAAAETQLLLGLSGSQRSLLTAILAKENRVTLYISYNQHQAETTAQDLRDLLPERSISVFTFQELLPHEEATTDWELRKSRLEVLKQLQQPGSIVCTSIQALSETLISPEVFFAQQLTIDFDTRIEPNDFAAKLVKLGYERVDMVEGYGQFSVRGGIIDIYSYTDPKPIRVELFDDEVDSIRVFDIESQLSIDQVKQFTIFPARERIYPDFDFEVVKDKIWADAKLQNERLLTDGSEQEADNLLERVAHHLELLGETKYFLGMDQYLHYFTSSASLIDYLAKDSLVIMSDPARVKEQAKLFIGESGETIAGLLVKGKVLPSIEHLFLDWSKIWQGIQGKGSLVLLSVLDKRIPEMDKIVTRQMSLRMPEHFQSNLDEFLKKIHQWRKQHYRILLVVATEDRGRRLTEYLNDNDIPSQYISDITGQLKLGNCVITQGSLETGFEYSGYKLVVCTDLEIYGRRRAKKRVNRSDEHVRLTESDLQVGDYVVHVNHGIGQYLGVETLEVQNAYKDYLLIKFAGQDRLYVPTDQIDLLQRYVGMNEVVPKLSKLGGAEWSRVKKRVKESVQEMAEGLIKLYAERESVKGFSYPEDTPWQKDFEDSFPYEETPDQMRAIEEVKQDMQNTKPMDRLLCGDVGYGKTEVAIRAAFKAVSNSKQVAVLVPTTILAQQHYRTFIERFENYPVKIGVLSRFQSDAEQKKVIRGLKSGSFDIVIGTHRLLSKDIVYHDLGLVVVDEEQRFGVAQKERLKEISKKVDVLTLSATPIPRTLHMSMVGVRDMSLIETPPEDRFPIRTYVVEWDEQNIIQAITRELGRQGQVYFVYNRVQGIEKMYRYIQSLVPEAKIAIAHGQMDEKRLEQIMVDFYNGEYDILLCTTIIETGMDIGNVNTLIIYDADYLGLAQLYQLRGRVGRTNRVAYAYFTYRRDKILTEDAEKRLQAIKEFSELGSGIKIAMRDLEIRGAGNILGPEQHGFITSVGFELYCKLLDEAIKEQKGETVQQTPDPVLDLHVDAYIDDQYVSDSKQKVELYKKMVGIQSINEADELEIEIEDRFSDLPDPVRNLLMVSRIKVLAKEMGIASIFAEKGVYVLRLLPGLGGDRERYTALVRRYQGKVSYIHGRNPQLKVKAKDLSDYETLTLLRQILQGLSEL